MGTFTKKFKNIMLKLNSVTSRISICVEMTTNISFYQKQNIYITFYLCFFLVLINIDIFFLI